MSVFISRCAYGSSGFPERRSTERFSTHNSEHGHHGPTTIIQLSLTIPRQQILICPQRQGIKTIITFYITQRRLSRVFELIVISTHGSIQMVWRSGSWVPHGSVGSRSDRDMTRCRSRSRKGRQCWTSRQAQTHTRHRKGRRRRTTRTI